MTAELFARDLFAYSLQLALLVGVGALLAPLLPLRPPAAALAYWQALLLACLILPFAQPWTPSPGAPANAAAVSVPATGALRQMRGEAIPPRDRWPSPGTWLGIVAAAGAAARGGWLAFGLLSLGRLRRRGRVLSPEAPLLARALAAIGVRAEFYSSGETSVPVTFGLRRPAVLLPHAVLEMEPRVQQAILYHELIHVRRRDWLCVVALEAVRALLWFHPAVAWLVGRIHLVREQTVDRAVVAMTESREDYVGALLEVARATARPEPMPAPLFLRKSRLKQRVAEILKEGTMTKGRLFSHLAASLVAILVAAGAGVRLFPLEARAAEGPVQVVGGDENVLHRAPVEYPRRAREKRVEGDVVVDVSLDEDGHVQDARVASGPDELRAAALQSVLRWHFAEPRPGSGQVTIRFRLPAPGNAVLEPVKKEPPKGKPGVKPAHEGLARTERQIEELEQALDDQELRAAQREKYQHQLAERRATLEQLAWKMAELQNESQAEMRMREKFEYAGLQDELRMKEKPEVELALGQDLVELREVDKIVKVKEKQPLDGPLASIHLARLSKETQEMLLPQLGVSVGDHIDSAVAGRIREVVRRFDEHMKISFSRDKDGGIVLLIVGP